MKKFLLIVFGLASLTSNAQYIEEFDQTVDLTTYAYQAFDGQGTYSLNVFSHDGPFSFTQDGDELLVSSEGYWEWDLIAFKLPNPVSLTTGDSLKVGAYLYGSAESAVYIQARLASAIDTANGEVTITEITSDDAVVEIDATGGDVVAIADEDGTANYVLLRVNMGYTTGVNDGWVTDYDASFVGTFAINYIAIGDVALSVGEISNPAAGSMIQNYPNPSNVSTTVEFELVENSNVEIVVTDITGQQKAVYTQGNLAPGTYSTNISTEELATGVYFYSLKANGSIVSTKHMMVK